MAAYGLARARYASDAAETVSPARLLTMLYDRLVADLVQAEDAMANGDHTVAGDRLGHAQAILLELHATLDTSTWSGADALNQLYIWIIGELMRARQTHQPHRVADCRGLLEPLREAWHTAAGTSASSGPSASGVASSGVASSGVAASGPVPVTPALAGTIVAGSVGPQQPGPVVGSRPVSGAA